MASFRADGELFDGKGVEPDVMLSVRPTDFLRDQGDSMLEEALNRLK